MIVVGEDVARFVSARLGVAFCPPYSAMGLERGGKIVAGVLFNHFEGPDVHVSVAGCGWTASFIRAVGAYVFDTLGCERMTAVTEQTAIVRLAQRMGGQIEGRMRNHFGCGRDGMLVGILKDEWRYGSKGGLAHG